MNQILNQLPTPTWNHLGVNQAAEAMALPERPAAGWGRADFNWPTLPRGVTACPAVPAECLDIAGGAGERFDAWVQDGANLSLSLSVTGQAEEPVLLTYGLDPAHPAAVADVAVYAAPGSALTLIEVVRGDAPQGVHGSRFRIFAGENAAVTVTQVQLLGAGASSWSSLGARCADGARVTLYRASLGGANVLAGSRAELAGRDSAYECRSVYYGSGEAKLDFNDVAVHLGRSTASELHGAGALEGSCQKTLRGTIDFRRGAVHAVGHESEDVLLLSENVRNRTAPLILCGEEQVEGQHAATAGRLDQRVLYYMAARGIGEAEARRLMIGARFAMVVDRLPPDLRCEADDFIKGRLGL